MAGTTMWLNEINYFSAVPNSDFIEVGVPVEGNLREPFSLAIYNSSGNLIDTISVPANLASGSGLQFVKIENLELPDTDVSIALLRQDGLVRQFLSFGTGAPITALDGPAAGVTSTFVTISDTNPTRGIGLTGTASGPDGWNWSANVATVAGGKRNPGQTHTPTSSPGVEIFGGAANNTLIGHVAADTLNGEGGNDRLYGLLGNDTLRGGDGDDVLSGGLGADVHDGGTGNDTASYVSSIASVTVNLATGTHGGDAAGDTFVSIENFVLSDANDTFTMADAGLIGSVNLGAGNDTFFGGAGADRVFGGNGNDTINGGGGNDIINGQGGDDTINGGDGDDSLRGEAGADTIDGGDGKDLIFGGLDNDTIDGGLGDDRLMGDDGNDTIDGGDGKDLLNGGAGDDSLFGGDGNDSLIGGLGADTYTGGLGNDVMVTTADEAIDTFSWDGEIYEGEDTINGFEVGVDMLDFGGMEFVADVSETARWTQIELTSGTIVRVLGVTEVDLFGESS